MNYYNKYLTFELFLQEKLKDEFNLSKFNKSEILNSQLHDASTIHTMTLKDQNQLIISPSKSKCLFRFMFAREVI